MADGLNDTTAPYPQSQGNASTSEYQYPNGRFRFLQNRSFHINHPDRNQRTDRIAHVVAAVRKAAECRREYLQEREQRGDILRFGSTLGRVHARLDEGKFTGIRRQCVCGDHRSDDLGVVVGQLAAGHRLLRT